MVLNQKILCWYNNVGSNDKELVFNCHICIKSRNCNNPNPLYINWRIYILQITGQIYFIVLLLFSITVLARAVLGFNYINISRTFAFECGEQKMYWHKIVFRSLSVSASFPKTINHNSSVIYISCKNDRLHSIHHLIYTWTKSKSTEHSATHINNSMTYSG